MRTILHNNRYVPPINHSVAARLLGEEQLDNILWSSQGMPIPIPIINTPWYAMDGMLLPASTLVDDHRGSDRVPLIQGGAGFSSLSDLINEATVGGKRQDIFFNKVGVTGVVAAHNTLWYEGSVPVVGQTPPALAAGADCTNATAGALGPQINPGGSDGLYLTTANVSSTVAPNCLVLYDRLWHGTPAVSTSGNQTVTMTPPRYATTTSPGNVVWLECQAALSNTAHTHTITYVDQDGNTAEATAAYAGFNSCIAKRIDHENWFIPLNSGDTGFRDITIYANSASVTGAQGLVAAHPLAYMATVVANRFEIIDGINSAFNLPQIQTNACLALIEIRKSATTATTYNGNLILVAG